MLNHAYSQFLETIPEAVVVVDRTSSIIMANSVAGSMFGFQPGELPDHLLSVLIPQDLVKAHAANVDGYFVSPQDNPNPHLVPLEVSARRRDGQLFPADIILKKVSLDGDLFVLAVIRDVSKTKQAEENLLKFQFCVNQAPDAIFWLEENGNYSYVNDEACRSLGYTRQELMDLGLFDVDTAYPRQAWRTSWDRFENTGQGVAAQIDSFHRRKDGVVFPVEVRAQHIWFGKTPLHVAFVRDITERRLVEEKIKASLAEKEILLKEIHHRVKNNLQVISSLLYLQSRKVSDPAMLSLLLESQNRVTSMALIHEKLYRSPNLESIDFGDYARELAISLFQSYGVDQSRIDLVVDAQDQVLDVTVAVPCGLLINEIVSNALKYAFPGERRGAIRIEMKYDGSGRRYLILGDDGIGLPSDLEARMRSTLGITLIERLVDQFQGTLERNSSSLGTVYRILFPLDAWDGSDKHK